MPAAGQGHGGSACTSAAALVLAGLLLAGCTAWPPAPGLHESDSGIVFENGVRCAGTAARPAAARRLFVAPHGSDSGSGSRLAPFRTLAFALCNLRGGQVLSVLPGTYRESVVLDFFGDKTAPVVVRGIAAGGRRPVLDGESRRSFGIALGSSRNVTIENLTFRNYTDAGVHILLGSDLIVRGNRFVDNGRASVDPDLDGEGFGLNVVGASRVLIERNEASGNGPGPARRKRLVLGTGVNTYGLRDAVVRDNFMHDNTGGGLLVEDGVGVLVDRNRISGNELDGGGYWDGGIWVDGGRNVILRGNTVTGNHGPGIQLSDEDRRYPRASYGYVLERNVISGNVFGLYIWNFRRCPLPGDSIVRLAGNRIEDNERRDVWCIERA